VRISYQPTCVSKMWPPGFRNIIIKSNSNETRCWLKYTNESKYTQAKRHKSEETGIINPRSRVVCKCIIITLYRGGFLGSVVKIHGKIYGCRKILFRCVNFWYVGGVTPGVRLGQHPSVTHTDSTICVVMLTSLRTNRPTRFLHNLNGVSIVETSRVGRHTLHG